MKLLAVIAFGKQDQRYLEIEETVLLMLLCNAWILIMCARIIKKKKQEKNFKKTGKKKLLMTSCYL